MPCNNVVSKQYIWEPGGSRLLLSAISHELSPKTYYALADANKNVSDLIDGSGNIVAHYEYSPFGKIHFQSGIYADENPIRFSSEYFDDESGLVYYNYRYYSPELDRWNSSINPGWSCKNQCFEQADECRAYILSNEYPYYDWEGISDY